MITSPRFLQHQRTPDPHTFDRKIACDTVSCFFKNIPLKKKKKSGFPLLSATLFT